MPCRVGKTRANGRRASERRAFCANLTPRDLNIARIECMCAPLFCCCCCCQISGAVVFFAVCVIYLRMCERAEVRVVFGSVTRSPALYASSASFIRNECMATEATATAATAAPAMRIILECEYVVVYIAPQRLRLLWVRSIHICNCEHVDHILGHCPSNPPRPTHSRPMPIRIDSVATVCAREFRKLCIHTLSPQLLS